MDPATHGMTGLLIGCASGENSRGRLALWTVAAMAPDLDALAGLAGRTAFYEFHRAALHGVAPAAALAALTGFAAARAGLGTWRRCAAIAAVALGSHLAIDAATSFGTALWFPFSRSMTHGDLLFAVDLGVSAILLLFVGASWVLVSRRRVWGRAGLAALLCYLAAAGIGRGAVASSIRAGQVAGRLPQGPVSVLPQPPWIASWAAFVDSGAATWAGSVRVGQGRPHLVEHLRPEPDAALTTARQTPAAVRFLAFARFPHVTRTADATGATFDFEDLRFSISGWEHSNRWYGVRVVVAPDGEVRYAGYAHP